MNKVNRYLLRGFIDDERIILRILVKATNFRITKDKMTRDIRGNLISAPHFDVNDWIEKQSKWTNKVRSDWVQHNKNLLNLVKNIRDKLIIEELTDMKFSEIETIFKDIHDNYKIEDRKLSVVIEDLKNRYIAIKF